VLPLLGGELGVAIVLSFIANRVAVLSADQRFDPLAQMFRLGRLIFVAGLLHGRRVVGSASMMVQDLLTDKNAPSSLAIRPFESSRLRTLIHFRRRCSRPYNLAARSGTYAVRVSFLECDEKRRFTIPRIRSGGQARALSRTGCRFRVARCRCISGLYRQRQHHDWALLRPAVQNRRDPAVGLRRDMRSLYPMYSIGPATYRAKAITSSGGSLGGRSARKQDRAVENLGTALLHVVAASGRRSSAGASERTPQL
jgi:hypothetical protein